MKRSLIIATLLILSAAQASATPVVPPLEVKKNQQNLAKPDPAESGQMPDKKKAKKESGNGIDDKTGVERGPETKVTENFKISVSALQALELRIEGIDKNLLAIQSDHKNNLAELQKMRQEKVKQEIRIRSLQERVEQLEEKLVQTVRKMTDAQTERVNPNMMRQVSQLTEAANQGAEFFGNLLELQQLLPEQPNLQAIEIYAATGVPTLFQLHQEFLRLEKETAITATGSQLNSTGWKSRFDKGFAALVTTSKVQPDGDDLRSKLARIRLALEQQNLGTALDAVSRLDPMVQKGVLQEWIGRAKARADLDAHLAALQQFLYQAEQLDAG